MKKATPKSKGAQGCMKISSFFNKQIVNKQVRRSMSPSESKNTDAIVVLDSDEDSQSLLTVKRKVSDNKRKFSGDKTSLSPPLKKSTSTKDLSPSQPSTSGITPSNSDFDIKVCDTTSEIYPSTSGETPVKNRPVICIKSAEKLLSPDALKEYYSPDKVMERFLDRGEKKITPVKLCFTDKSVNLNTQEKTNGKSSNKTPPNKSLEKNDRTPNRGKTSKSTEKNERTPNRSKKTPKKLFNTSPSNLNKFNVEVLRNFVRVTPSKNELSQVKEQSGSNSRRSLEAQMENEKTPVKDLLPSTSLVSPKSKAKTKLFVTNDQFGDTGKLSEKPGKTVVNNGNVSSTSNEKENFDLNNIEAIFNDDSWETEFFEQTNYTLDLSQSKHCKIIKVNHKSSEVVLTLKCTKTNELALCTLQGFWIHSKLCIGDNVHIKATKLAGEEWLADNQNGFLVYEPDFLLSSTSVVNSVFCKRRTVFSEKFRGFEPANRFMIVGSMVHTLLQQVLKNKLYNHKDIESCAKEIFNRKEWMRQIYESGEPSEIIAREFFVYVSKVHDFVGTYVQNGVKKINPKPYKKDDWKGAICSIEDIEENIWCPELGIKGKVDVSIKSGLTTMPLEVKTGRASLSLEHRGQVLLYIMMMNKFGYKVSSGLLLYLKEGILREISPTAAEKRDIMILRNELAYYLTRTPKISQVDEEAKFLEPCEIPEPIDHHGCNKCPYSNLCVSYSRYINEDISNYKHLKAISNEANKSITLAHVEYFMSWSSLLAIEMKERGGQKSLREIYTVGAKERKNKGKCLIDLKIVEVSEECNGTYSHTFKEDNQEQTSQLFTNFMLSGFTENTYVVISVPNRPAVATGFITDISIQSVTVSLDRNLNDKYSKETFYLDSYDSATFLNYNLGSLLLLLDDTEKSKQMRAIIIDRQPATFQSKLPKVLAEKAKPILKRLNRVQQRAVLRAIAANDYFLIKGMPGTGKTATIVALVQLLVELKKTVLITSHTHSAVDTVCLKLKSFGVKLMRLGNVGKMNVDLREFSEHNLTKDCSTPEELEEVYSSAQVLAVTCLGSGHPVLSKRTLDICIVDESTQVLQCSVFRPLFAAKTFILIGDPDQLPAVVRNRDAVEMGMSESLFERLYSSESCTTLDLNYRMNEPITSLANILTYNGELLIGADRVAKGTLNIPHFKKIQEKYDEQNWLISALDRSLENAVQCIDTGPVWSLNRQVHWAKVESFDEDPNENQRCSNVFEAAVIYHLVRALLEGGVSPQQIGVIATYRAQVAQIISILQSTNVDINTVDQFQGKDKSVIIYSCSKSKDTSKGWHLNKFDLLEDKRRLNVAITRAKHKLIIVGDMTTLENYSTFKKIKSELEKNIIRLVDCEEFSWDKVLNIEF